MARDEHTRDSSRALPGAPDFDETQLRMLAEWADDVRATTVGEEVHLRGLIEICNICRRHCAYCGLRAGNRVLPRVRMEREEIIESAEAAVDLGCRTVVLQSGEYFGLDADLIGEIIREIKSRFDVAVTLSLGERGQTELRHWRDCGADRYLLKFETSDRRLYARYHPPRADGPQHRLDLLPVLRDLGYEVGSGIMVGLPGQTWPSVAADFRLFAELDLDMIAIGPWVPHPFTPLGSRYSDGPPSNARQVPNTYLATRRLIALARILCPEANIPLTAALSEAGPEDHLAALRGGCNVVMLDVTPAAYRVAYDIYPSRIRTGDALTRNRSILRALRSSGRPIGKDPGSRVRRVHPRLVRETFGWPNEGGTDA